MLLTSGNNWTESCLILAIHIHNCSPGIELRRACMVSCFSLFLPFSSSCSDTPNKGISDGFDQICLPREITHLAWSCNEMILLLQSKHKHGIHHEGTKMGDSFWFRHSAPRLLGGGVDQWRKHSLSLFYNAALCFFVNIWTSTIF